MAAAATGGEVDVILDCLEAAAKQVETSSDILGTEKELLKYLADLQGCMEAVLQQLDSDDLDSLQGVFGGDCSRIGRTRAILEGLRFEEKGEHDIAKQQSMSALTSVEKVLVSTGSGEKLTQAQESEKKALFQRIRRELELEYVPEDDDDKTSEVWDDHPSGNNQMPAFQMAAAPPSDLRGHIWKKSPAPLMPIRQWKWRWVVLSEGKLRWYASEAEANSGNRNSLRGEIDFALNACNVGAMTSVETQFSIRPNGGKWMLGAFTGADEGREFLFDAFSSQFDRDTWVSAIKTHLKHSNTSFGGTRLSFMGK